MPVTFKRPTKFNRMFDPEFLDYRKDITPVMIAAAKGDIEFVANRLSDEPGEIFAVNRDQNTLLLLAVANQHAPMTRLLLEAKSDIMHLNGSQMDALDYAVLEGVTRSKVAKVVLEHCDFVAPAVIEGLYWAKAEKVWTKLRRAGQTLARASVLGNTPNLADPFSKETEYRVEWVRSLNYMASTVRKGILLPDDSVEYLERDALLNGSLEVPMNRRYVFCADSQSIIRYQKALGTVYAAAMKQRIVEVSLSGDAVSVQGLLKAHAHPNMVDPHGQTLLMRAVQNPDVRVLKCLLHAQAHLNAVNKDGFTAFMLAASGNHETSVRMLLKARADLKVKSHRGTSVLDFAKHEGNRGILKIIDDDIDEQEDAMVAPPGTGKAVSRAIKLISRFTM